MSSPAPSWFYKRPTLPLPPPCKLAQLMRRSKGEGVYRWMEELELVQTVTLPSVGEAYMLARLLETPPYFFPPDSNRYTGDQPQSTSALPDSNRNTSDQPQSTKRSISTQT